jgi:hypothetical protein
MELPLQRPSDEGDLKTGRQDENRADDGGENVPAIQGLGPADADYDVETVERVYRFVVSYAPSSRCWQANKFLQEA